MMILGDLSKNQIHTFKTYRSLYNHLEILERSKGKGKWIFARHSHQRAVSFYKYIRGQKFFIESKEIKEKSFEESLEQIIKQATKKIIGREKDKNVDVLEITNGDVKNPVFIPVTPDVDVEALQKQWCQNYCKGHGLVLVEVSGADDFKQLKTQYAGGQHDHATG